MIKKILLGICILLVILVIVIALQPSTFSYARTATFNVPAETVFEQVNDLHKWQAWSPWAKIDPNAKNSFEGPASGVGAIFGWSGNNEVGEGRMTITESKPNELIIMKLDFIKPFEATSTTEFTFKSNADKTTVTWKMLGTNNFIGKAISLFIDCEKMIGDQFEKGFSNLKSVVETQNKK
jgi:uncharacterized protein YndB with AHSA1/START domain